MEFAFIAVPKNGDGYHTEFQPIPIRRIYSRHEREAYLEAYGTWLLLIAGLITLHTIGITPTGSFRGKKVVTTSHEPPNRVWKSKSLLDSSKGWPRNFTEPGS